MKVLVPLLKSPHSARGLWLVTAFVCGGCLLQATTSTTLVGVKVSATFPGAGSVAGAAPAAYDASEGPPNEETVTYTASGKPLKITVRLTKEEDFNSPRQLLVNDKDYGTVTTADEVHVQGDEVKVNGTVRSPK